MGFVMIPLKSREGEFLGHAKVDYEDAPVVSTRRWFFDGMYAATKSGKHNLRLHRLLVGRGPMARALEVDHINRDKLDNRRSNLRLVPHSVNGRNVPSQQGTSSFRGVSWSKERNRWVAQASHCKKNHFLGYYTDEEEAAKRVIAFWESLEDSQ